MTKPRYPIFDLVKFVLAFLVVNLHVESFIVGRPFSWLYYLGWYAVPLFITLTFYFTAKHYQPSRNVGEMLGRWQRLLTPFVFWSALGFLANPDKLSLKLLARQLTMGTAVNAPLYYLLIVFWLSILLYILSRWILRPSRLTWVFIITFSLLLELTGLKQSLLSQLPIQLEFFVSRFVELIKYGTLGILASQGTSFSTSRRTLAVIAALLVAGHLSYLTISQPAHMDYGGLSNFVIVTLLMLLLHSVKEVPISWINRYRKTLVYSLGVYCLHNFFVDYFVLHPLPITDSALLYSLLIFGLSLLISWLIDAASRTRLGSVVR